MTPQKKKLITGLISNGQTARAIEALTELLENSKTGKTHLTTAYNISARYHKLLDEKSRGILFKADEEVLQNRIHHDLLNLLERTEKPARPKPAGTAAKPSPAPTAPATEKPVLPKKNSSGLTLLGAILAITAVATALYFVLGNKPVEVQHPKICLLAELSSRCCPESLARMRTQEAGRQLYVSLLLNKDLADPSITGVVYDQNRNLVPVQQLSFTIADGAICYASLLKRTDDALWPTGRYTIEFSVDQQPAGSMNFTIIP